MTESGVLLIAAAAVIAVCAAPVLYVLWRDRARIWSLEQRLLRLEAGQDSVARLDRVARLEGRFERALRLDDASERLARLEAVSERFPSVEDRVSRVAGVLEFFAEGDPRVLDQL
ncbi:MAG: hypothetical protein OXG74_17755, partial [Acidobacteria bacterium]|nr:hypothetical protein [Acidobacteriota bacterium]